MDGGIWPGDSDGYRAAVDRKIVDVATVTPYLLLTAPESVARESVAMSTVDGVTPPPAHIKANS